MIFANFLGYEKSPVDFSIAKRRTKKETSSGLFDSEAENNNALTVEICGVLSARLFLRGGGYLLSHSAFLEWGYCELVPLARIKFLLLHSQYTSLKKQAPQIRPSIYLLTTYTFMRFLKSFLGHQ